MKTIYKIEEEEKRKTFQMWISESATEKMCFCFVYHAIELYQ